MLCHVGRGTEHGRRQSNRRRGPQHQAGRRHPLAYGRWPVDEGCLSALGAWRAPWRRTMPFLSAGPPAPWRGGARGRARQCRRKAQGDAAGGVWALCRGCGATTTRPEPPIAASCWTGAGARRDAVGRVGRPLVEAFSAACNGSRRRASGCDRVCPGPIASAPSPAPMPFSTHRVRLCSSRWNTIASPVIYASGHYSTACWRAGANAANLPPNQHFIEIARCPTACPTGRGPRPSARLGRPSRFSAKPSGLAAGRPFGPALCAEPRRAHGAERADQPGACRVQRHHAWPAPSGLVGPPPFRAGGLTPSGLTPSGPAWAARRHACAAR